MTTAIFDTKKVYIYTASRHLGIIDSVSTFAKPIDSIAAHTRKLRPTTTHSAPLPPLTNTPIMRMPGPLARLASPQLRLPTQMPHRNLTRETMRQPVPGPPPPTGSQHGASGGIFGKKSAGGTGGPDPRATGAGGKPTFTTQMWSTRTLVLLGTAVGSSVSALRCAN